MGAPRCRVYQRAPISRRRQQAQHDRKRQRARRGEHAQPAENGGRKGHAPRPVGRPRRPRRLRQAEYDSAMPRTAVPLTIIGTDLAKASPNSATAPETRITATARGEWRRGVAHAQLQTKKSAWPGKAPMLTDGPSSTLESSTFFTSPFA